MNAQEDRTNSKAIDYIRQKFVEVKNMIKVLSLWEIYETDALPTVQMRHLLCGKFNHLLILEYYRPKRQIIRKNVGYLNNPVNKFNYVYTCVIKIYIMHIIFILYKCIYILS